MIKKNIYLLYFISFLQGMVFYSSVSTLYRQNNGITIFQISIIESISLALCIVLEIPWGIAADKFGYKKIMVICSVLFFVSKILFWQSKNFTGFLFERIILSIVISGLSGVDTSILYLSCKKSEKQFVFGLYNSFGIAGLLISTLVFSIFISDNYKISAFLTVITYFMAAVLSFFLSDVKIVKQVKKQNEIKHFIATLQKVFKNKYLLMFIIGTSLFNQTYQTISVFLNQIQFNKCRISSKTVGYVFIISNIVGLLSVFSSIITNILSVKKVIIFCFCISISSCIILAATNSAILSVIAVLLLTFAFAIYAPLQNTIENDQIISTDRATILSVFSTVSTSIGIITNYIFGAFTQFNISLGFCCGIIFCVIGFIFTYIWVKKSNYKGIIK